MRHDSLPPRETVEVSARRYTYHYAAEYVDRGYSVVPREGTSPIVRISNDRSRRTRLDDIAIWFGDPSATTRNVGIVTGQTSGLVVVETKSAEDMSYWLDGRLRSPLSVPMRDGRTQIYYRYPRGMQVETVSSAFNRGINILGDGAFVIAPPSILPDTGEILKWNEEGQAYRLADVPIFDSEWFSGEPTSETVTNVRVGQRTASRGSHSNEGDN